MSRRAPNPAADRAAQNQQTIKTLLKLEGNKSCADCKRNKHPRWASWNLGIFICIRCSGIHRGMGTHISRVKSVDLDAWTDEQLQSVLRWGNSRANTYWEAKLAPGHVPSEAKIENFIRTKYESKRWVMDGPMPDPATLDTEGDDDVVYSNANPFPQGIANGVWLQPLNVVQQKAKLERASSQRASPSPSHSNPPSRRAIQAVDLFNDDTPLPPVRPSTTDSSAANAPPAPPRTSTVPPKETKPADSLLGLDFFGSAPAASQGRTSTTASSPLGTTGPSRPDLKQSILSLYASNPRSQPEPQSQRGGQGSSGAMQSPPSQQAPQQSSFGGMNDALSRLSFAISTSQPAQQPQFPPPQPAKPSAFADLSSFTSQRSAPAPPKVTAPSSFPGGGGFFDTTPKPVAQPKPPAPQPQRTLSSSSGFGAFSSASGTDSLPTRSTPTTGLNDLFDFSETTPAPLASNITSTPSNVNSAFNLSGPVPPDPPSKPANVAQGNTLGFSTFSTTDPWASNDAWATPEPAPAAPKTTAMGFSPSKSAVKSELGWASSMSSNNGLGGSGGFGATSTPKVSADEDFGGWNSAAPVTPAAYPSSQVKKPAGGFGGGDDLFSNVWE